MLKANLQRREDVELDEAELFDVAGDIEPARDGLYPLAGGESGEESEASEDELVDFDDVPPIHTPPNPELRSDDRFASSWAAGAMNISGGLGRAERVSSSQREGVAPLGHDIVDGLRLPWDRISWPDATAFV